MPKTRLALKSYWYTRRKPYLELTDDVATLRAPAWFRGNWAIATSELGVVDLKDDRVKFGDANKAVIASGVLIPYLFTTGPLTNPTTCLLFRSPQRVPPVALAGAIAPNSALGVGYRESRSEHGATLDGCLLRFDDGTEAHRALIRAGAEAVLDPVAWLSEHRRVAYGKEAEDIKRQGRWLVWMMRSRFAFIALMLGASALMGERAADSNFGFALIMGLLLAAFVVPAIAVRIDRRGRREELNRRKRR
jgi:hypothetical protein